jgi:hypothetical protein
MPQWFEEAKAIDAAVYAAIAETEAPAIDAAMRRLSRTADHSKLWFGTAAGMALLGGPSGRRAARHGLVSLGAASALANLVVKPLTVRARPQRSEPAEPARTDATLQLFPLWSHGLRLCFRHRCEPCASGPLGATACTCDAGRILAGPYRRPFSR